MLALTASLLAGLGLFFVGLRLLTENLKVLSGKRLRESIAEWTKRPLQGVLWGGVFIAITQSAAAATFILIGMLRAGMMTVRQILPVLIGVNVFGGVIVIVLIFDIKLAVLFLIGVTGLVYSSDRAGGLRAVAGAAFGVGMIFLGLSTTQSGVAPLAEMLWFQEALAWTGFFYTVAFAVGAVLTFAVQSSLAVVVLTVVFLQGGVLSLEQSIMIAYGSKIGSSALTLALSSGLSGESRQVATFQVAYNVVGAAILVPAFYVETYSGVPLVAALAARLAGDADMQLALINFFFNVVPGVLLFFLVKPAARALERRYPETAVDQASKPKYLYEQASDDPVSALRLIELEQVRLVEILPRSFEAMRRGGEPSRLDALHEGFRGLAGAIRSAIGELSSRHQLSPETYERLNGVLSLQHGLEATNDEVRELARGLGALEGTERGERFARVAVDGIDAILLTVLDVARERSPVDIGLLEKMTSEHGVTRVRKAYLAEDSALDPAARMQLLSAANNCERLIWLFRSLGRAYRGLGTL
jgi:phosphate:Na+ symporter